MLECLLLCWHFLKPTHLCITINHIFFFINSLAYCDSGAKHLFIHKGILIAKPSPDLTNAAEDCIEHAINAGAEEVETDSDDLEPGHYKVI